MAAIFELDIKVQDEVGEMPALPLTAMARCGNNPGLARRRREPLCRGKRRVSPMVPTTIWEEEDEWRLRLEENGGGNRFCDCVPGEENSSREEKEDGFDGGVLFMYNMNGD
ncbi:hypothetical protein DEO72_LG6g1383 [Vigna unguiculata]|uniref:Uncharacterized protein n=1 Tax=Vigna unguiculata TaxID=3917 RepID=A0A4D6M983_VIGUN|nr:hypothetical protein DEO72_LG6g1383 [Vigna unguiculata]